LTHATGMKQFAQRSLNPCTVYYNSVRLDYGKLKNNVCKSLRKPAYLHKDNVQC